MSFLAQKWAETAPVKDTYERIILIKLARHAWDDGTHAYPSVPTMAEIALCDGETIRRRLRAMQNRGLIARGDQSVVINNPNYRPDRRPVVYDLLIPRSWYSDDQWEDIQAERSKAGKAGIDPASRPDLVPPGQRGRAERSDRGKPNPKRSNKTAPPQEGPSVGNATTPLTKGNDPSNKGLTTPLTKGNDPSNKGANMSFNQSSKQVQKYVPVPAAPTDLFGNSVEDVSEPSKPDSAKRFEDFWFEVPRKDDKKAARKAWSTAVRAKNDPGVIIEGMRRYALLVKAEQRERRFIKTPAAWINGEKWTDEFPDLNGSQPPVGQGKTNGNGGSRPFRGYSDAAYDIGPNSVWSMT